ncbi:glycosyl transferase family 1 [Paenibacillus sp. J45TS6]|uniref:glycosyltransferase family 4 protein n=1 Tax=unclassified Paenibacillus TaxID=185978 RepID=UPI001B2E565F|nr:glycosyltransferase family 4 protein [Paenibacillus sp. J45TS6]GIP42338.1 glycosyl transferase family 1 [Paenibacillus sp. J45TS6]
MYVSILTHSFADGYNRDFERLFGGGLERYIYELCQVIRSLGHTPQVHQLSYYDSFHRHIEEIEVFGYAYDPQRIPDAFEEMASQAKGPLIYASCIWHPLRYSPNSLGICHGINWDRPSLPSEVKQEVAVSIQHALDHLETIVSVDSHFLTFCRAVCTFNDPQKIILIPNAVDTHYFKPLESAGEETELEEHTLRKRTNNRKVHLHQSEEELEASEEEQPGRIRILFPRRISLERGIIPMMLSADYLLGLYPQVEIEFAGERVQGSTVGRAFEMWMKHHPHKARILSKSYLFDEMITAYHMADIAVIPTIFSEGTSYACLEAMSCGIPVVASNVGGLNDLIQDGFNGLLVSPEESHITAALCRLIDDEDLRLQLGKQARKTALSYDEEKWKSAWKKVLIPFLR